MSQLDKELKVTFRTAELHRRAGRRLRLLNEAKLLMEELSPEEQEITAIALTRIAAQQQLFERDITISYWKRLWLAILNR